MLAQKLGESSAFDAQLSGGDFHCSLSRDQVFRSEATGICSILDKRTGRMESFTLTPVGKQWRATFGRGALTVSGMSQSETLETVFALFGHDKDCADLSRLPEVLKADGSN